MKRLIKKILKPFVELCRKIVFKLMRDVTENLESTILASGKNGQESFIPYSEGETIRMLFLFQAASFWPSWESFYQACLSDPRIQVKFAWLDELYGDTTQMLTAGRFLEENNIEYEIYSNGLFEKFRPHILVMQTPYDYGHRDVHVRSAAFRSKGTRIVYIPYGIELADTEHARSAHFLSAVVMNSWRVFTFSERMQDDYKYYCPNSRAVKCLGSPKFDALYHKERFSLSEEIKKGAAGKKILVWHVHFPKLVPQPDGTELMSTPGLKIYLAFAKYILKRDDIFTVLLPHPKFLDGEGSLGKYAKEIVELISASDNGFVDWADDYRSTLLHSDIFITDRSALMIEVATTGVPILYMYNDSYYEPLTAAIQPLMDSYYHGTSLEDMTQFVEQCMRGEDPKKELREAAFQQCIPYFDGHSGERIKDHIVDAIMTENQNTIEGQINELRQEISRLNERIDRLLDRQEM